VFLERVPLEGVHDAGSLARIRRHRLSNKERVEKAVGRSSKIDRREVMRDIFGQLKGWIVVEIAREIERDVELTRIDDFLPVPDVAAVLRDIDPDLLPALRQEIGS